MHWIFWLNVPLGLVLVPLAFVVWERRARADAADVILLAARVRRDQRGVAHGPEHSKVHGG